MEPAADYVHTSEKFDPPEWWGREQFLTYVIEQGYLPCPEAVDLTGPHRPLAVGPEMPLEPGLWRATVILELCVDGARRPIAVEFGSHPNCTIVDIPRRVPGRHEIKVEYRVQPGEFGQVRVYLNRAAFHGELRFIGARIERIGEAE